MPGFLQWVMEMLKCQDYSSCDYVLCVSIIMISVIPIVCYKSNNDPLQLSVLLASFAVTMVSVFPLWPGAMDTLVVVLMAVMREDAVS